MNRRTLLSAGAKAGTTLLALGAAGMIASQCVPTDAPAAVADPMLDFVGRYRAAMQGFEDARPHTDASCDAFCDKHFTPLCDEARDATPVTVSQRGATESVRLALFLIEGGDDHTGCALLTSALDFLDGRT